MSLWLISVTLRPQDIMIYVCLCVCLCEEGPKDSRQGAESTVSTATQAFVQLRYRQIKSQINRFFYINSPCNIHITDFRNSVPQSD